MIIKLDLDSKTVLNILQPAHYLVMSFFVPLVVNNLLNQMFPSLLVLFLLPPLYSILFQ